MSRWRGIEPVVTALASLACFMTGPVLLVGSLRDSPAYLPPPPEPARATLAAPPGGTGPAAPSPALAGPPPDAGLTPADALPNAPASRSAAAGGLPRSVPVLLTIPRIGVSTPLITLELRRDGSPEVPPLGGRSPAGWVEALSTPGEVGPAVVLGHVDSAADGPAVFYRLAELRPGDLITVERADHRLVSFAVTSTEQVAKTAFPAATIYGPVDYPALRLITCGGSFDHTSGHYRDNIVVFAAATNLSGRPTAAPPG
ncbi:MAG TPA: class F sortase [Kineosporiaceae bacterium]